MGPIRISLKGQLTHILYRTMNLREILLKLILSVRDILTMDQDDSVHFDCLL